MTASDGTSYTHAELVEAAAQAMRDNDRVPEAGEIELYDVLISLDDETLKAIIFRHSGRVVE